MNATLPFFTFQRCHGLMGDAYESSETSAGDVPPEFDPAGPIPFLTDLGLDAYECPRVVHGNATFENVAMLWSYMAAIPRDDSWKGTGLSYYTYDVLVSNASLAAALRAAGTSAAVAVFTHNETPLGGAEVQEAWRFVAGTLAYNVTFRHSSNAGQVLPGGGSYARQFWFGTNPYHRLDVRHNDTLYEGDGADGPLVEVSGGGAFQKALGRNRTVLTASTIQTLGWEVAGTAKTFGKGTTP